MSARVLLEDVESRDPEGAAARSPPPSGAGESSFATDPREEKEDKPRTASTAHARPSSSQMRRRERALIRPTSFALDTPLQRRGLSPAAPGVVGERIAGGPGVDGAARGSQARRAPEPVKRVRRKVQRPIARIMGAPGMMHDA